MCGWYTKKDGFIGKFAAKLNTLEKIINLSINFLQGYNAGKNESFFKEFNGKYWHMGITPEWTPRATCQPNCVENQIYVITMCGCALLAAANVPDQYKNMLLPYAVKYTYITRGLEFVDIDSTTSTWYKHLCGELPKFINYVHPFGESDMLEVVWRTNPSPGNEALPVCLLVMLQQVAKIV